jgi:hypothetical protein
VFLGRTDHAGRGITCLDFSSHMIMIIDGANRRVAINKYLQVLMSKYSLESPYPYIHIHPLLHHGFRDLPVLKLLYPNLADLSIGKGATSKFNVEGKIILSVSCVVVGCHTTDPYVICTVLSRVFAPFVNPA